jgi:hypothetical protein
MSDDQDQRPHGHPWRGIGQWRSHADAVQDGEPDEDDPEG